VELKVDAAVVREEAFSEAPRLSSCPRCSTALIDPKGFGLCPRCGYCRSLENSPEILPPARWHSDLRGSWYEQWSAAVPGWLRVLLAGVAGLGVASFAAGQLLPEPSAVRAIWTLGQLGLGLVVIAAAQLAAYVRLSLQENRLGLVDLIFPDRLWSQILTRMPEMRWPVWLGAWGLAAMIFAVLFIGGLTFWFR
jgi:hypothetical protein